MTYTAETLKKPWLTTALAFLAATTLAATPAHAQMLMNGAGATFPYPIYSKWFDEYAKVDTSVRINYQSIGSGGGIRQITERTVDFGASDGPMNDEQLKKAPAELFHIPTVLGADVATYNLPGNPQLRFTGEVLADIFLGKITKWNHDRIKALNPSGNLPDQPIAVVHRSEGSGTTYISVDYLCKVSKEWEQKVGRGTSVSWPVGLGGKGNEGVAGLVKNTPGARSGCDRQDRGAHSRAQEGPHGGHRDPQHAAGCASVRTYRLLPDGRAHRIRCDQGALHDAA